VDSAVLQLVLRREPPVNLPGGQEGEAAFFRLIRAAFGQRRKTAANAVSAGLGMEKSAVLAAMGRAGIAPNARAEELQLEDFARLLGEMG